MGLPPLSVSCRSWSHLTHSAASPLRAGMLASWPRVTTRSSFLVLGLLAKLDQENKDDAARLSMCASQRCDWAQADSPSSSAATHHLLPLFDVMPHIAPRPNGQEEQERDENQ